MILFRHVPSGYPFLWESISQPAGRWHAYGEGPAHYMAGTPDGAWAEFIRHQDIREPEDLAGISRDVWAIEVTESETFEAVKLDRPSSTGTKYEECQAEARRLRASGAKGLKAPSAALLPHMAGGFIVKAGLKSGPHRDGEVFVLFGIRPDLVGWKACSSGKPSEDILKKTRYL